MDGRQDNPLRAELQSIHSADVDYWMKGTEAPRTARAEYYRRQNRVLELRAQFTISRSPFHHFHHAVQILIFGLLLFRMNDF
jgi:hypothetical protein